MTRKTLYSIYIAATVVLLTLLLHHHKQIVDTPVPLDLYEGTAPLITGIIADGHNPYTRDFQPGAAYVYPPLYNILVAPLTTVFDNDLLLHRLVSATFILLCLALCYLATRKQCEHWCHGLAAATLLYAALLFYGTPVASANAPGVALYMAGLIIPWLCGFSTGSLWFALACGVLSFYTKQYFILGTAILCLYLFLFVSMSRALMLGIGFSLCLLASLFIVHKTSPYYLDNTLFTPQIATHGLLTWAVAAQQFRFFASTYAGLISLVTLVGLRKLQQTGYQGLRESMPGVQKANNLQTSGPLLSGRLDYFWFWFFWATLANLFWLGRNPGNFMTYLFQLMSPPLVIASLALFSKLRGRQQLLAPLMLATFYQAWAILPKDFSTGPENWKTVSQLIEASNQVLATQMLISALMEHGKPVFQNGHTFYFPLAAAKPALFIKDREEDRVSVIWKAYIKEMYKKIENQEFDLVLVSLWEIMGIFGHNPPPESDLSGVDFLKKYYQAEERIPLSMTGRHGGGTYRIQIWKPRPNPVKEPAGDTSAASQSAVSNGE
jgi:4-amino-4-deoxy-L-arabinose transferase-like glycosyltransferase